MLEALALDDIRVTIGKNIRHLRESRGISQKHLAEKMGVRANTMSGYESGNREPDASTLLKISEFFNVSVDFIYGKTSAKNNHINFPSNKINDNKIEPEHLKRISDAIAGINDELKILINSESTTSSNPKKEYKVEDYISPDADSNNYDALIDLRGFMIEEGMQNDNFGFYDMNEAATMSPKEVAQIKINLLKARERERNKRKS